MKAISLSWCLWRSYWLKIYKHTFTKHTWKLFFFFKTVSINISFDRILESVCAWLHSSNSGLFLGWIVRAILWKKTEESLAELDKLQQIHLMCRTFFILLFFSMLLASVNLYFTAFSIGLPTDNLKYKDSVLLIWCLIHITWFGLDQAGLSIQVPGQQDLLVSTPAEVVLSVIHDSCKKGRSRGFCCELQMNLQKFTSFYQDFLTCDKMTISPLKCLFQINQAWYNTVLYSVPPMLWWRQENIYQCHIFLHKKRHKKKTPPLVKWGLKQCIILIQDVFYALCPSPTFSMCCNQQKV